MTVYGYTKNTPGSQATTKSWTRSCDVGNTIAMFVQHQSTGNTVMTVNDNSGSTNVWTKVASSLDYSTPGTGQQVIDLWVCKPTVAINTINFTASAATYWVAQAKDYAGVYTVRAAAQYAGSVSGSTVPVTATTGDLLVSGIGYNATTAGTQDDAISGWTADGFNNISTTTSSMWEKTATTTGSQGPTYSVSHSAGVIQAALYIPGSNAAPVIAQPARIQMTGAGAQLLQMVVNDSDGTVASGAITWVSGPTPTDTSGPTLTVSSSGLNTASATFSATPTLLAGRYVFLGNATDNSGASAVPVTWIVDVPAASAADVQTESITASAYANVGGAADIRTAVSDTNSATYAESPAAPTGQILRAVYLPFPLGDLVINCYNYSNPTTPAITVQATVYKEDGVTQVYQTSFTAPTGVSTLTPITLDSTALGLISTLVTRRALVVTFAPTQ